MRRVWTKEEIINIIMTNDDQCGKAVVYLYNMQTVDEQNAGETVEHNGYGFNGVDANIMTSFAEFYIRAGFLTPKQLKVCRRRIKKYGGQLTRIVNGQI